MSAKPDTYIFFKSTRLRFKQCHFIADGNLELEEGTPSDVRKKENHSKGILCNENEVLLNHFLRIFFNYMFVYISKLVFEKKRFNICLGNLSSCIYIRLLSVLIDVKI